MADDDIFTQALTGQKNPANKPAGGTVPDAAPKVEEKIDKLEAARMAMEGPERTAKRHEEEREEDIKKEIAELDEQLAVIIKDKEGLELKWVELDDKRTTIKKVLDPIKEKEQGIEAEEMALETEETRQQPFPKEQHATEEKRWLAQETRHKLEGEKWPLEQKIITLDEQVAQNTAAYQKLLDQEEELKTKRRDLEKQLPPAVPPNDGQE